MRLDLQGLRALAVGLVVLNHAFEWPAGGFVGVDIFFVISGFLMTSVLHREFERNGRIRFLAFYRRRIRRLIPASVAVLIATVVASWALFSSGRFVSTVWDAVASLFFVSNWRFASQATDYFAQGAQTSPLQHYWSLSLEEQYYLVWPLAILLIALLVGRTRRPRLFAGLITFAITSALFFLSLHLTQADKGSAYFITPARLWELSVGATVALCMPWFSKLPLALRPFIALAALAGMITASVITPADQGFPAPWAALAVLSTAAFIAFPWKPKRTWLNPLDNPFFSYIGDISYSLYLWHFPALILVTELARGTPSYDTPIPALESIALSLVLAALSYRFIEEPVRHSSWLEPAKRNRRRTRTKVQRYQSIAVMAVSATAVVAIVAALVVDRGARDNTPEAASPTSGSSQPQNGALSAIKAELVKAVGAKEWPELNPSMDSVITDYQTPEAAAACSVPDYPGMDECTWGSPDAKVSMAIVGDSTSVPYVATLRAMAEGSNGLLKATALGMFGCPFVDITTSTPDKNLEKACPERKLASIENIGTLKPDVLFITNTYFPFKALSTGAAVTPEQYEAAMKPYLEQLAPNVGTIVFLPPPPVEKDVKECYTPRSVPQDCLSTVPELWQARAKVDQTLAKTVDGAWIDTRVVYCVKSSCPAFSGGIPIKSDIVHLTSEYATHIAPAVREILTTKGILPADESTSTAAPPGDGAALGAIKTALTDALGAKEWPETTPALGSPEAGARSPEFDACAGPVYPGIEKCTWGAADAPVTITVVGDSTAVGYLPLLRTLVDSSNGKLRITSFGMYGCPFIPISIAAGNETYRSECPKRREAAIEEISTTKPSYVFVSNLTSEIKKVEGGLLTVADYKAGLDEYLKKIAPSTGKVVMFATPPEDKDIRECYSPRSEPAACVTRIQTRWKELNAADSAVVTAIGGVWVDTRPLFCVNGSCPAFADGIPTKFDKTHITEAWSRHIAPAARELLVQAGVDLSGGSGGS
ncbi:acyltransferase [Leifsonia shinshuensis]|uniref:acyltransferase family protein n=1 Tax=Leifsonia shinshuensis TaxID=150026 RepID=UPI001F50DA72|nr:acyltransferase family protein [Leifsonia shinshuensis]MCI0155568.1 acyltransferase [Leifsonia shinshuensis]